MIYAYLRVSTILQDEANQKLGIDNYAKTHGLKIDKYIIDKVSGITDPKNRNLGKLMKKLQKGDTIIASEISRLSRRLFDVIELANELLKKQVNIHTVKENFDLGDNLQSQIIIFAFGLAAEIEKNMIVSRTKEALALCKLKGQKLGRPVGSKTQHHKLDNVRVRLCHDFIRGFKYSYLAKRYNVSRKTIIKYIENHINDVDIIAFKDEYKVNQV